MIIKRTKFITGIFVFVFLTNTAFAFSNLELNEFLNKLDVATNKRDLGIIANALSERAEFNIELPTPNGKRDIKLNKEQYISLLKQGWSVIGPSYKYNRVTEKIKNNSEYAQVISVVHEEFKTSDQLVKSKTLEITDITIENGNLVIVKIVGQSYIHGEPIPEPSI